MREEQDAAFRASLAADAAKEAKRVQEMEEEEARLKEAENERLENERIESENRRKEEERDGFEDSPRRKSCALKTRTRDGRHGKFN